jgi:hypothetical protein
VSTFDVGERQTAVKAPESRVLSLKQSSVVFVAVLFRTVSFADVKNVENMLFRFPREVGDEGPGEAIIAFHKICSSSFRRTKKL